jgi:hypothetical protein
VAHDVRNERAEPHKLDREVYGDWDDDPANRRTDVYFLLRS